MSEVFEALGRVQQAHLAGAQALQGRVCNHADYSHHYEFVEYDQAPEQQSLRTEQIEICDGCGEEVISE